MNKVYITRLAKYLPNSPVSNDEVENFLGTINGRPSRARKIVLARNGINRRYYALDAEQHVTLTNAELATNAVESLFDARFKASDIELLAAGTSSPDQLIPSHAVMVHGHLGGSNAEVVSMAGTCCTGIQALKYCWLSVLSGEKSNAVCVGSERMSAWMRSSYFESEVDKLSLLDDEPMLAFEKEFLRWMLSDGAAALLLRNRPAVEGLSLAIEWIEICSYANIRGTCMYAGADRNAQGMIRGWTDFPESEWLERSIFAIKQDTRLLGSNIVSLGGTYLRDIAAKRNLAPTDIDWFLPHLSSMFFKSKIMEELAAMNFPIPEEKWFLNLPDVGNVGSASGFLMLEELFHSGRLKSGQRILVMIPESARFSYGYCLLRVV